MIAVDTNVLVHAHRSDSPIHGEAEATVRSLAEGVFPWAIPWPCYYEFLSVVTNRRIWRDSATTVDQGWAQLSAWTASYSVRLLGETENFLDVLGQFIRRPRVQGGRIHDARIAAICVAHGVDALLTQDRDLSAFPELNTLNPFLDT